ncbi:hypothetical protein BASA81_006380 [Batrachochytrium salamandrivorans]|nr:hypothetical protein BASA81_006380 [Batrachochytrium salamandrivorans]
MSHRQSLHVGTLANCRAEQQRRLLAHPPKLSFNQFVVFVTSQQQQQSPASAPSPLSQPQRRTHNYTPWLEKAAAMAKSSTTAADRLGMAAIAANTPAEHSAFITFKAGLLARSGGGVVAVVREVGAGWTGMSGLCSVAQNSSGSSFPTTASAKPTGKSGREPSRSPQKRSPFPPHPNAQNTKLSTVTNAATCEKLGMARTTFEKLDCLLRSLVP